jgi:arsenate reductase-like glutaredoxin family protein
VKIKVFGKSNCAKCETTKNKLNHFITKNHYESVVEVEFHDMDMVDGMAEGAFYDVLKIPTTIVEKGNSAVVRWEGDIPKTEEIAACFV